MTSWERRIRNIDRKVKPTAIAKLGLRGRLLKDKVKKRRGLPSRSLPIELVLERLNIEFRDRHEDEAGEVACQLGRLERAYMHERLMERKRRRRDAARRRARPSSTDSCIYLWRRRREWLRDVEANR